MARTSSRSPARASAPSTRRSNSPRAALAAPTDQEARKPPSCPGSGHAATLALDGRPRVALDGRPLTRFKKTSRRCWGRYWIPRAPDGDRDRDGAPARHRSDVHGARGAPGDLLPTAAVPEHPAAPATVSPRAQRRRAHGRSRRAARAAIRGSRAGRGLRDPARRGPVPLLRAHDVSRARGTPGGGRAPEPAAASALRGPRAAGPAAERALELGHHEVARPRAVDLLLPVRDARRVQPVRGRLDGRPSRERRPGRTVHP